jgi:hypothetical protein
MLLSGSNKYVAGRRVQGETWTGKSVKSTSGNLARTGRVVQVQYMHNRKRAPFRAATFAARSDCDDGVTVGRCLLSIAVPELTGRQLLMFGASFANNMPVKQYKLSRIRRLWSRSQQANLLAGVSFGEVLAMSDVVNFRSEVKENPFSELLSESRLSRDLWSEIGKHGGAGRRSDPRIQEIEKQLKEVKPVVEHYSNTGLTEEKRELLAMLDNTFGKATRGIFSDELRQFETRAWANAIGKNEIAETYKEIGRILADKEDTPLTPELRKQVARDVIRNCCDPSIISQGHHNTCNVTAVEVRTYALYPAKAAKLMADLATTGEHSTQTGIKVRLDAESMKPDSEALMDRPAKGLRTYATQLFNLAAVNIWYGAAMPGTKYEQREQILKGKPEVVEQLTDYSHGKPVKLRDWLTKEVIDNPHLGDNQIAFISDSIVGKHEPFAVLKVGPSVCFLPGEKTPPTKATNIVNEHELPNILLTLKKRHLLPAIAGVDTDVEPLNKDTGSGAYGPGGGHVVNLFDYQDGVHPKVAMDNQWSQKDDHLSHGRQVDLHDMFLSMAGKEAAKQDAIVQAEQAKKLGLSTPKEDLLALSLAENVTADGIQKASEVIANDKNVERSLTGAERGKWFDALQTLVNTAPVTRKVHFLEHIQRDKVCTDEEFGRLIAGAVRSVSHRKKQALDEANDAKRALCITATKDIAEYLTTLPSSVKKSYFQAVRD